MFHLRRQSTPRVGLEALRAPPKVGADILKPMAYLALHGALPSVVVPRDRAPSTSHAAGNSDPHQSVLALPQGDHVQPSVRILVII